VHLRTVTNEASPPVPAAELREEAKRARRLADGLSPGGADWSRLLAYAQALEERAVDIESEPPFGWTH
jgi:hypothetical protein